MSPLSFKVPLSLTAMACSVPSSPCLHQGRLLLPLGLFLGLSPGPEVGGAVARRDGRFGGGEPDSLPVPADVSRGG